MIDHPYATTSNYSDAERLRLALDAARLGDWSWDAVTDVVTFSPRAAAIFDMAPGTAITWTDLRATAPR